MVDGIISSSGDHFSGDYFFGDHFSGDHFSRGPFFRVPFFSGTIFPGTIFLGNHFSGIRTVYPYIALSYLISNAKYMDFFLLNPVFNFHTLNIVKFITFFTVQFHGVQVDYCGSSKTGK